MIYNLEYKSEVKWDIQDAFDYYKAILPKLSEQFLFRIKEATNHIVRNPLGFQIKYNEVRTLLISQFPYQIHYLVDDKQKLITIIAVVHSYRNPADYSAR